VNWNYQYNSLGKVTEAIDPNNRTFSSAYAANNIDLTQVTEIQNGDNFLIGAWTYNSQHEPLTYEDGSGQVTQYAYNSSGQLISFTDANSNTTTMTYTGTASATIGGTKTTGNVLTLTVHDAGLTGGQKAINYTVLTGDTLSSIATNLAAAVSADTSLQAIGVSATAAGTIITLSSTSVNVTTYTQSVTGTETIALGTNTFGFLTKIDGPLAGTNDATTFTYDSVGRLASRTDSESYTVAYSYDNADRLTQTTYPDGTSEQIVYDRLDAVFKKDRIGRWSQDSFDMLDQISVETDPLGRQTQYTWCSCGSLMSLTDGNGHTTSWQHDLQGRIVQKNYPDGSSVKYAWDTFISRIRKRTDALGQNTYYTLNSDNTPFQVGYLNAVNATAPVTYNWDNNFKRLSSVGKSDWGTISYTYNSYIAPGGAATTGGGQLQLVHNNVIPNSDITYTFDALGRTTNRSINSTSNSDSWTYDSMSRITNETNALGSFGYNYVDDVSGSSKGTTRLSSITYPNSQVTNFNWYPNIGDQRLQGITNLKTSGGSLLSQFNYGYDSAGQITQWQQQQNGNNLFYNLGYDQAGQLTSAQAGSGGPQSPPANEFYYGYDAGANRTSVQTAGMQTIRIGGTKTTGNVLTITVQDTALAGGQEAVSYTVLTADTLATIAQGLATSINQDVNLQAIGVVANAHGTNTFVNIKSASNSITTYATSTSGGATETLTAGIFKNGLENAAFGGTKTTSDVLTVTVVDAALTGGQKAISYTVLSGDTLSTIATAIKTAINADTSLSALGVTATAASAVVSISSNSVNATTYTSSTSSSATETISLTANNNPTFLAIVGGTKTTGDVLTLTSYDSALSGGSQAVSYTVLAADTLSTIATGLTSAINASTALQNIGVSATSSGAVVTITSNSVNQTSFMQSYSTSSTESVLLTTTKYGWQVAALGGTKTTGDLLTFTVYNAGLSGGKEAVSYTVLSSDTLTTIASGIAAAVNADTNLSTIGVTATSSGAIVNLESIAPLLTTYAQSKSTGATETIAMSTGYGVQEASFNSVNELVGIAQAGAALFKGTTDKPVKSASVSTQVINLQSPLPAVTTSYAANVSKTPTETLTEVQAPGTVGNSDAYLFTVGGTPTTGDIFSITFFDVRFIPTGKETISYTVLPGDTLASIANGISTAIGNDPVVPIFGYQVRNIVGSQFYLGVPVMALPPFPVGITTSVTSSGSEQIALALAADENTAATISGTVTTGDVAQITVMNNQLAGGQEAVSHTVTSGETTSTIASALATALNADTNLQAVGVGASSSGAVLTLAAYTYFTTSVGAGTETLSVSNANRSSAAITVGGVATTGDVVSITAHDAALTGGSETASYTVLSTDTLLSISQALASAINADTQLQALGVTANSSLQLANSQSFTGNALLPTGSSLTAANAVDGSSNVKSNGYAYSVNGGSNSTLTYDLNGNMLSDGTNSYAWDAENRMIKITYPGTNNFSSFVYDSLGRRVKIVETVSGSVTSTKQFVWAQDQYRLHQPCESRNSGGTITAQYFALGETISGADHYWTKDHLGSIREMTSSSGTVEVQMAYDLYGRASQIQGSPSLEFQYAGYYNHSPSGLLLTKFRAMNCNLGRFISRDPIREDGGLNLFAYVGNSPSESIDPSGLQHGASAGPINQWGCVSVVNQALHQQPGVSPEDPMNIPPGTKCWWGNKGDPNPAAKKCKNSPPCPPGQHKVIWCKVGWMDQTNRGASGTPNLNPSQGWDSHMQAKGQWDYSTYDPATNSFTDANSAGVGNETQTNVGSPAGASPGENASFCCSSCIDN
jgi:RHS repeat-associated protein